MPLARCRSLAPHPLLFQSVFLKTFSHLAARQVQRLIACAPQVRLSHDLIDRLAQLALAQLAHIQPDLTLVQLVHIQLSLTPLQLVPIKPCLTPLQLVPMKPCLILVQLVQFSLT